MSLQEKEREGNKCSVVKCLTERPLSFCEQCKKYLCQLHFDILHKNGNRGHTTINSLDYQLAQKAFKVSDRSSNACDVEKCHKIITIANKEDIRTGKMAENTATRKICFVGPPSTGKSTIIKQILLFLANNNDVIDDQIITPLVNDPEHFATTSDITAYESSIGGGSLLIDTESGGEEIPWTAFEYNDKERKSLVHRKHPQFLYYSSDIVVFVVNHQRKNLLSVLKLIWAYTQIARNANLPKASNPHLIVVFNKMTGTGENWYTNENEKEIGELFKDYPDSILNDIRSWYRTQQAMVIPLFSNSANGYIKQTKVLLNTISQTINSIQRDQDKFDEEKVDEDFESTFKPIYDLLNIKRNSYCSEESCYNDRKSYCNDCDQLLCQDHSITLHNSHKILTIENYKEIVQNERILLSKDANGKWLFGPMWSTLSYMNTKDQDFYIVSFFGQSVDNYIDEPIISKCESDIVNCYVEYPNTINNKKVMIIGNDQTSYKEDSIYLKVGTLISDVIVIANTNKDTVENIVSLIKQDLQSQSTSRPNSNPHLVIIYYGKDQEFEKKLQSTHQPISFIDQSLQKSIEKVLKERKKVGNILQSLKLFVDKNNTKCSDNGCTSQAVYLLTGKFKCENHYNQLKSDRLKEMCIPIDIHAKCQSILKVGQHETDAIQYDRRNKLFLDVQGKIELGPKWYQCGLDGDQIFKMVTFIGPTGSGKSSLIRGLCYGDSPLVPLPGNIYSSTSSNVNAYLGKTNEEIPFLIADCEGFGGTLKTTTSSSVGSSHRHLVESLYPRLMYPFSDIIVCVCSNSWQEQQTIRKYVQSHAQHSDAGTVNKGNLPHLILVFNKKAKNDMNLSNEAATKEFFVNAGFEEVVRPYYRSWSIIRIASDEGGRDPQSFLCSYQELKQEIYKHITGEGKQTVYRKLNNEIIPQSLTTKEVMKQMCEVVHRFNDNITEINFIEIQPIDPKRAASYLFKYFRLFYSKLSLNATDKLNAYEKAINHLNVRLKKSKELFMDRYPDKHWSEVENMLKTLTASLQPCSQTNCHKYSHQHGNVHKSITTKNQDDKNKESLKASTYIEYDIKGYKSSDFKKIKIEANSSAATISHLVEELDAPKEESRVPSNNLYIQLTTHVCVNCLIGFPDQVRIGCQHLLCFNCSLENKYSCPVEYCNNKSESIWIQSHQIPKNAGYRLLNLDDIGFQVIDQLIILKKIQEKLFGIDIRYLFDLCLGSGLAGLSLLALTQGRKEIYNHMKIDDVIKLIKQLSSIKETESRKSILEKYFPDYKERILNYYDSFFSTELALTANYEGGVALFTSYNAERTRLALDDSTTEDQTKMTYKCMFKSKPISAAQSLCLSQDQHFTDPDHEIELIASPHFDRNVNIVKEAQFIWKRDKDKQKKCDILLNIGTSKGFTHHPNMSKYLDQVKKVSRRNAKISNSLLVEPSTIFKLSPPQINSNYFLTPTQIDNIITKRAKDTYENYQDFGIVCDQLLSSLFYISETPHVNAFEIKLRHPLPVEFIEKLRNTEEFFKVHARKENDKEDLQYTLTLLPYRIPLVIVAKVKLHLPDNNPTTKIFVKVLRKDIFNNDDKKYYSISGPNEIQLSSDWYY